MGGGLGGLEIVDGSGFFCCSGFVVVVGSGLLLLQWVCGSRFLQWLWTWRFKLVEKQPFVVVEDWEVWQQQLLAGVEVSLAVVDL